MSTLDDVFSSIAFRVLPPFLARTCWRQLRADLWIHPISMIYFHFFTSSAPNPLLLYLLHTFANCVRRFFTSFCTSPTAPTALVIKLTAKLRYNHLFFYLFCYLLYVVPLTQYTFQALNGLLCADVPLRNYSSLNTSFTSCTGLRTDESSRRLTSATCLETKANIPQLCNTIRTIKLSCWWY